MAGEHRLFLSINFIRSRQSLYALQRTLKSGLQPPGVYSSKIQIMKRNAGNPFSPRYLASWIGLGFLWALSLVPMRILYPVGTVIGDLLRTLISSRRQIAERNLELCMPHKSRVEIHQLVKENFRNIARMALYTGTVWWAPKDKLLSLVTVKNQHLLTEILETGQGVVLIAPHMVGLELGGIFLSLRFDGISIYQYSHNPVFDRAMLKARQRFGAKLFERKSNLRHLIRAIQQGKPCYYLPDQDPGPRRAVFASFFGISTATWPVLGRLSQLGRAKTLTCATYMKPDGKGFEIVFGELLKNFPSGDDETDTTTMN